MVVQQQPPTNGDAAGTDMATLTVKELEKKRKDARASGKPVNISESSGRGAGVLRVRISPSGNVVFFYRYTNSQGQRDDYIIGTYAPDGRGGLTLDGARTRVGELMVLYRGGVKDVRQYLEARAREEADERRRQTAAAEQQKAGTLKVLLETYIGYLKDNGKQALADARSGLTRHVIEPFPDLVGRRANLIEPSDLTVIFDRLTELGHTRTLGKVRAFLHSAYALASRSPFNSTIPVTFRAFAVSNNPVAPLPTYSELSKPGDKVLTHAELGDLLKALDSTDTMASKALRAAIYLGGQRPTQMLRVTAADVDQERGTITLRDGKGRRMHARLHVLPLEPVETLLETCIKLNRSAPSLFSSDGERSPHQSTLSNLVTEISKGAYKGAYKMSDIRRTCETELARLGVSKDIRAQILSHALGGIQDRHYDRHTYLEEKRAALMNWGKYLDSL